MSSLTLDWLHVIVLLGAIQGVFLAGVLAARRRNRTANRLLAVAMLAFSIYLASAVYHAVGYEKVFPHFFGAAYPLPFLYGPLIYLYAVTAADRNRRLTPRDALHFVPFLATVAAGLPVYFMSGAEKIAFYQRLLSGQAPAWFAVADVMKLVSGVTYAAITIVFLGRHREQVKESYSSTERVNLRWLLWLGAGAATIWLMAVAIQVLESAGIVRLGRGDDIVALGIAVLVYGIGYMGLRQPEVFRYETAEYPVQSVSQIGRRGGRSSGRGIGCTALRAIGAHGPAGRATQGRPDGDDGAGTSLAGQRAHLADLAARLKTTPHKLSEVLNSLLGQTFYDFVNAYRVREVQRRIAAGEAQRVKMLTLALDAGFASKSTFNLVFKKHTSQTPSDYRQAAGV